MKTVAKCQHDQVWKHGPCAECGAEELIVLRFHLANALLELDELKDVITENDAHQKTWDALQQISLDQLHISIKMFDTERAAHESTKQELKELRADMEDAHQDLPDLEECEQKLTETRNRLKSAEAALREYTGVDTPHSHIAINHFERHPGEIK